jgi:hypothetical protein
MEAVHGDDEDSFDTSDGNWILGTAQRGVRISTASPGGHTLNFWRTIRRKAATRAAKVCARLKRTQWNNCRRPASSPRARMASTNPFASRNSKLTNLNHRLRSLPTDNRNSSRSRWIGIFWRSHEVALWRIASRLLFYGTLHDSLHRWL